MRLLLVAFACLLLYCTILHMRVHNMQLEIDGLIELSGAQSEFNTKVVNLLKGE